MKKIKQYSKEEIKALTIEYNNIVKEQLRTNKESMPYRVAEAMVGQNYVRPYIQLWCNETKSGELEKLYLDWAEDYDNKQ